MCCLIKKKKKLKNYTQWRTVFQWRVGSDRVNGTSDTCLVYYARISMSQCTMAQSDAHHVRRRFRFLTSPFLSSFTPPLLPSVVSSCRRPEFRFVVFFLFLLLLRSCESDSSRCPDVVVYRASSLISPKDKGSEKQPSSATCTDPKKPFDFEHCMRTARASHD